MKKGRKSLWMLLLCGIAIPVLFWYMLSNAPLLSIHRIGVYLGSGEKTKQARALSDFGARSEKSCDLVDSDGDGKPDKIPEDCTYGIEALRPLLPVLIQVCKSPQTHYEVRLRCGWALQKFDEDSEVESLLLRLLMTSDAEDPEHWIKYNAALALARQGNQKAKPELQSMLAGHNPPNVRQSAAHVYFRLALESDEGFVRTFINDKDPVVRGLMKSALTKTYGSTEGP